MKAKVYSISFMRGGEWPHIAVFTTDGTVEGNRVKMYDLSVKWLPDLLAAMASVSGVRKTYLGKQGSWTNWTISGRYQAMADAQKNEPLLKRAGINVVTGANVLLMAS